MKEPNYAPTYAVALYPDLAVLARKHGYALACHGSLARDFDLICVPWAEKVSPPFDVVQEILTVFNVRLIDATGQGLFTRKNHGRIAYTLSIGHGQCAVDLSFLPAAQEEPKHE